MASEYLFLRRGIWQYIRRVPADLAALDGRGHVKKSTRRRDFAEAVVVARRINADVEAFWSSLAAGGRRDGEAGANLEQALRLARSLGVNYRPTRDLAAGALDELVHRVEIILQRDLMTSPPAQSAVLGGQDRPTLLVSELFDTFAPLAGDRLIGKSADQVRKWQNPRKRAVAHFLEVVGDKPLIDLTREDVLDFRSWWLDRVRDEGMDPGTANKDFGMLAAMVDAIVDAWRLALDNPFRKLRLAGERHNPRIPYEADYVRRHFLAPGSLATLNADARAITLMVALTGARPSEIAALTDQRIALDAPVPLIRILPEARQLKSRNSERDIPLVGQALEIMRGFAAGFPRYRDAPDAFSATANKALGAAGLRPTLGHTVYSLRHTFKDRLIALEAPERIQDALMGHAVREIKYGAGPSLEQRAEWLARVW